MTVPVERELAALGESLGSMRWVQGPGGNVSVKHDGMLYVKASGVRLREVGTSYSSVPLELATSALQGDADADRGVFAIAPRPSLETYFHVLGPRVVAHTHALGVLLAACSGRPLKSERARIPYERPGRGIALAVARVFGSALPRGVVVLESHGVVAFADSVEEAISLTEAADREARAGHRDLPDVEAILASYLAHGAERALGDGWVRSLPDRATTGRYLFPDAVVYGGVVAVESISDDVCGRALATIPRPSVLVDPVGRRVVVARKPGQLAYAVEVTVAHDWLEDALVREGSARYLSEDEPAKILDLPAEKYRLKL